MKLSNYENPLTGKSNDLFNISSLWSQILGVFVLVIVFMFGQKIADYVFPQKAGTKENPQTSTRIYI
jgi:hypothetical protein